VIETQKSSLKERGCFFHNERPPRVLSSKEDSPDRRGQGFGSRWRPLFGAYFPEISPAIGLPPILRPIQIWHRTSKTRGFAGNPQICEEQSGHLHIDGFFDEITDRSRSSLTTILLQKSGHMFPKMSLFCPFFVPLLTHLTNDINPATSAYISKALSLIR